MRWLSRLTTVAVLALLVGVVIVGAVTLARPPAARGGFRTSALFRDASGLPTGSRVVIAGVNVGRIESLTIEGGRARVAMRLRDGLVICDDAWATKKAESALGDNYVEISPGDADPASASGCAPPRRRLASGEPVARVVEAASTERVLRGIQNAMPRIDEGLGSAEAFLAAVAPTANRRMDDFAADVAGATDDLRGARADVRDALGGARARIDEVDPFLDDAGDTIAALVDPRHERAGTLAKMIHDPELADDVTDVTEAAADFTRSLARFRNVIGFRTELNVLAREPRYYVTAEVAARADTFYYIELEKGHWGDVPEPRLDDATGSATWTRRTSIVENLRITAQWGKRFGPISLRAGVKESMFGAGIDGVLGDGRLKLSLDVMESSFDRVPRVKLAAAFAVFRTLYIVGGVDDALVEGATLPIQPWPDTADVPVQFQELHYGRDYFLGLSLNFTDSDMDRLLFVYGGILGALIFR
mgnify:CR=1 FL=1